VAARLGWRGVAARLGRRLGWMATGVESWMGARMGRLGVAHCGRRRHRWHLGFLFELQSMLGLERL
jgi:hypothetical protein